MTNTDLNVATVVAALILAYLISTILNKDRRKETDVMPQAPFSSDRLKEATEKLQQFKITEKEETNDEQNPLQLQCAYERGREDQKREFKEYLEKKKAVDDRFTRIGNTIRREVINEIINELSKD